MKSKAVSNELKKNIKVIICDDYATISQKAAAIIAGVVSLDPECVLGLATGSSPVGMYQELVKKYEAGELDFSKVKSYNLDEYYPIDPENDQSYHYFMDTNLFKHINIDPANVHVPSGNAEDIEAVCDEYEKMINEAGGIDIQVLGIGNNGHIGFNEPADAYDAKTHLVDLQESTIKANARFFEKEEDVPRQAISMGVGSILKARRILLVANGAGKANAIAAALEGPITPQVPASALQLHPDVTVIVDKDAASLLKEFC